MPDFKGCIVCGQMEGNFHFQQGEGYCSECYNLGYKINENQFICNGCLEKSVKQMKDEYNTAYEDLYICYKSGQISEPQWQEHLRDNDGLRDYLKYETDYYD